MSESTAARIISLLRHSPDIQIVDITGGAPEINPNFRALVKAGRESGRQVIDRCNLTILLEPGFEALPEFLAENHVAITASLPCYTAANVDKQRGRGVFEKSILALQRLNSSRLRPPRLSPAARFGLQSPRTHASPSASCARARLQAPASRWLRHRIQPTSHHRQHAHQPFRRGARPQWRYGPLFPVTPRSLQSRNGLASHVPLAHQHRLGRQLIRLRFQSNARNVRTHAPNRLGHRFVRRTVASAHRDRLPLLRMHGRGGIKLRRTARSRPHLATASWTSLLASSPNLPLLVA